MRLAAVLDRPPRNMAHMPVSMVINQNPPAALALKRGDASAIRSIILAALMSIPPRASSEFLASLSGPTLRMRRNGRTPGATTRNLRSHRCRLHAVVGRHAKLEVYPAPKNSYKKYRRRSACTNPSNTLFNYHASPVNIDRRKILLTLTHRMPCKQRCSSKGCGNGRNKNKLEAIWIEKASNDKRYSADYIR